MSDNEKIKPGFWTLDPGPGGGDIHWPGLLHWFGASCLFLSWIFPPYWHFVHAWWARWMP